MWEPTTIIILAFVAVSSLVLWLGSSLILDRQLSRRVEDYSGSVGGAEARPTPARTQPLAELVTTHLRRFGAMLAPAKDVRHSRLQTRLWHAGVYADSALPIYLGAKVLLMIVPPALGGICGLLELVDLRTGLYAGVAVGSMGGLLQSWCLDRKKAKRQRVLRRGLPDFMDLLVSCVQAGLSLQGAVQRVTEELKGAHAALAHEMRILQFETGLGCSLPDALRRMEQRTGLEGVRSLATVVEQSQRFGATVGDALRVQSDMMRAHREMQADELANKAAVKILLPMLLFIFPAIFVVLAAPAVIQVREKFANSSSAEKQIVNR